MSRRLGSHPLTVERPRQKGWWGVPDDDQVPADEVPPAPREPVRRVSPTPRPAMVTTRVGRALTPNQIEAIRTVMRIFVDDDLAHGVDPRHLLLCHRCQAPRRAAGSVRYERLTFCHECSTEYEISCARGLVDSAGEFCERFLSAAASA